MKSNDPTIFYYKDIPYVLYKDEYTRMGTTFKLDRIWTTTTNQFSLIKDAANTGSLISLRLVWSWRFFTFLYKFEFSPTIWVRNQENKNHGNT